MPEVELKLTADLADLPRIRRASLEMAGGDRAPRMTLVSTYYDTADRRLARRRLVLRVRRQGRRYIQAVKSQDLSGAAAATRGEWEVDSKTKTDQDGSHAKDLDRVRRFHKAARAANVCPL